jgi:type VI secretion system secreted protein Hcp
MAFDYFLRIDGVPGSSTDAKHKGEIEVESFSFGVSNQASPGTGAGGGAGRSAFQDLSVIAAPSSAGPKLLLACASGQHMKSAVLTARRAGGAAQLEFLSLTLSDVLVSAYQESAGGGDVGPMDQVSLNFAKIKVEYKEQKADGSLGASSVAGWDVKANQKF